MHHCELGPACGLTDADRSEDYARELADQMGAAGHDLARHLQNISEAMADFDLGLAEKWAALLREHAWGLAVEVLSAYVPLAVIHSWHPALDLLDDPAPQVGEPPAPLDAARWPAVPRKGVRKGVRALLARTRACTGEIDELQFWLLDYLEAAVEWRDDPDPGQVADDVARTIGAVVARVEDIVELWRDFVVLPHRKLAASQKGRRPPRFVEFERYLDELIAKLRADRPRAPAA